MRSLIVLIIPLALFAVACSQATPTPTATSSLTSTPRATPAATATLATLTLTPVFLRVTSPKNESIVTTATIQVIGETTPDAVVSVNGQLVEVDATGRFQAAITLVAGPNEIDLVASDFTGRQAAAEVLTLLYVP